MKKRDMKSFFKDVGSFNLSNMNKKEKRASTGNTGKVKLPYKMY